MTIWRLDPDDPGFPPAELASDGDGLLAIGGDYSVPRLLNAYAGGIFPWMTYRGEITWHSPNPRFVLLPDALHIPSSLRRTMRKRPFEITVDRAFERVIAACALVPRPKPGTWISDSLRAGYVALHRAGFAHSVEAWREGELVGGFYGVSIRTVFCGESMFALTPDASKVAFATAATALFASGCTMIDCQMRTAHLARFGGADLPRKDFLARLDDALDSLRDIDWPCLLEPPRASSAP